MNLTRRIRSPPESPAFASLGAVGPPPEDSSPPAALHERAREQQSEWLKKRDALREARRPIRWIAAAACGVAISMIFATLFLVEPHAQGNYPSLRKRDVSCEESQGVAEQVSQAEVVSSMLTTKSTSLSTGKKDGKVYTTVRTILHTYAVPVTVTDKQSQDPVTPPSSDAVAPVTTSSQPPQAPAAAPPQETSSTPTAVTSSRPVHSTASPLVTTQCGASVCCGSETCSASGDYNVGGLSVASCTDSPKAACVYTCANAKFTLLSQTSCVSSSSSAPPSSSSPSSFLVLPEKNAMTCSTDKTDGCPTLKNLLVSACVQSQCAYQCASTACAAKNDDGFAYANTCSAASVAQGTITAACSYQCLQPSTTTTTIVDGSTKTICTSAAAQAKRRHIYARYFD